ACVPTTGLFLPTMLGPSARLSKILRSSEVSYYPAIWSYSMADLAEQEHLCFTFNDLAGELLALPPLAKDFLSPVGSHRLEAARDQIMGAKSRPGSTFTWEIPEEEPILTKMSEAEYEDKKKHKGPSVVGALSFKWHMRAGPRPVKKLYLSGNATTRIRLLAEQDQAGEEFSMWRMEIGASDSPGCCFHVQVLGEGDAPFPSSIPVPRFPVFPPTPMSCLEFLLSELFQRDWRMQVDRETAQIKSWRRIQQERLTSYLKWQLQAVGEPSASPLVHLKRFPGAEVLISP